MASAPKLVRRAALRLQSRVILLFTAPWQRLHWGQIAVIGVYRLRNPARA